MCLCRDLNVHDVQAQPAAAASHATNMATQPAATAAAAVAASDAHKAPSTSNAASTATARPNTRASNKHPPAKSKSQEIPKGKTTSNQRMTRAAAARVAAELADTAPGSMMEEDSDEDEDVAEGPMSEADLPLDMVRVTSTDNTCQAGTGLANSSCGASMVCCYIGHALQPQAAELEHADYLVQPVPQIAACGIYVLLSVW